MKPSLHNTACGLAVLFLTAGCASAPPGTPSQYTENLLRAAGFRILNTSDTDIELSALPQGQLTVLAKGGRYYFVYPDAGKDKVYIGTEEEYKRYLRMRTPTAAPWSDELNGWPPSTL